MTLASLIGLLLKISIALTVLSLGLHASREEAGSLFRRPGFLLRSLVSMNVIMPLIAVALASIFDLYPAVKLALVAVSVSPVPPFLPGKELKAGCTPAYTFGLFVATSVLAVILIPLSIALIGKATSRSLDVPPGQVATVVFITVLAPLAAGIFLHRIAPEFAGRIAKPIGHIATVMLVIGVVPILFSNFPAIVSLIGNGTLFAIIVFVLAGLAFGHLLGGPEANNRTVLALSTASRHPGVAMAIAHSTFPELKLAGAAILLYVLVSGVVSTPYLSWWHKHRPGDIETPRVNVRHA